MNDKIFSIVLAVIIGIILSQLFVGWVEGKVNQRLLNQYSINNHENSPGVFIYAPPPPKPPELP